jgi:fructose/tagatose bisphosphate aldolase
MQFASTISVDQSGLLAYALGMASGTTTVRVAVDTAERIAALRKDHGGSSDAVVREALTALYWSRMTEAARLTTPEQRQEYLQETALWDRAVATDAGPTET